MIDNTLYRELSPFLHPGEQVLWTGRPCVTRKPKTPPFIVFFMALWLGFAVFWTVMATAMGGAMGFFGIPFIAVGVFFLFSSTVGRRRALKKAVYAVTDSRIVILTVHRGGTSCTEYVYSALSNVNMEDVKGTTGTIRFAPLYHVAQDLSYGYGRRYRASYDPAREMKTAFLFIDDVQSVHCLICEQLPR